MYPAYEYDAISDAGLIKHEDLPDVMFGGGTQYNKIQPVEIFETRYGVYLDPTSPNEENEGYIYWNSEGGDFGPTWSAFSEGGRNCLVEDLELFWRDDFADTYTTIGFDGVEVTVVRKELCVWEGQVIIPNAFNSGLDLEFIHVLYYGNGFANGPFDYFQPPFELGNNLKWNLSVGIATAPFIASAGGTNIGPQNDQIGTYQDPISLETFFVNP